MENEELIGKHSGSVSTLLKIYNVKNDLYKGKFLLLSLGLNVILVAFLFIFDIHAFDLIFASVDLYIAIIPSLLGFNLGAYALLIGLGSSSIIDKLSKGIEVKYTTFQRASSVFGFCVLLQAISLIVAFIYKQIILIQTFKSFPTTLVVRQGLSETINLLALFLLSSLGFYSIIILIKVIENIFALSQASHLFAITERMKLEKQKLEEQKKQMTAKDSESTK